MTWCLQPLPSVPETTAASIRDYNQEHGTAFIIRQVTYLNNLVEQDHRAVKRVARFLLGFKAFDTAQRTLAGVELMHMLKKGQLAGEDGTEVLTPAEQFYALAAYPPAQQTSRHPR
jgi:putative transposase